MLDIFIEMLTKAQSWGEIKFADMYPSSCYIDVEVNGQKIRLSAIKEKENTNA